VGERRSYDVGSPFGDKNAGRETRENKRHLVLTLIMWGKTKRKTLDVEEGVETIEKQVKRSALSDEKSRSLISTKGRFLSIG